jgi:hypothetical protein
MGRGELSFRAQGNFRNIGKTGIEKKHRSILSFQLNKTEVKTAQHNGI